MLTEKYLSNEYIDSNGYYNMVLQYADNGTLREYLMTNFTKLQWTDKLCIAKEIALGLLFLHDNNIIHRDLVNIVLSIFYIYCLSVY